MMLLHIAVAHQLDAQTATSESSDRADQFPHHNTQNKTLDNGYAATLSPDLLLSAPDTAFIGLTRTGQCDTLRLPLTNTSPSTIVLDVLTLTSSSPVLYSLTQLEDIPEIRSGEVQELLIVFCPTDTNCVDGQLEIQGALQSNGDRVEHTVGLHACGGTAIVALDPPSLDFGRVLVGRCHVDSVVVSNRGNYPLHLTGVETAVASFSILKPDHLPLTILPGQEASVIIEFCPDRAESYTDVLRITSNASNLPPVSQLSGQGALGLSPPIDSIDFGDVLVGRCRDTTIVLYNLSATILTLTELEIAELTGTNAFEILHPPAIPLQIDPEEPLVLHIRFCPDAKGQQHRQLTTTFDPDEKQGTALVGNGIIPRIWLDSAHTNAGEEATLNLYIWPAKVFDQGEYHIEFRINPDALFVREVASQQIVTYQQTADGVLTIEGVFSNNTLNDNTICQIAFLGLITGQEINPVEIRNFDIASSIARWDTLPGIVYLSGCEVGRTPGIGKRASIRSVQPNPALSSTTLTYQAPKGRVSTLSLFDCRGQKITAITLPEGSGQIEELHLPLDGLPRGMYMLELVERNERQLHPLLIGQ